MRYLILLLTFITTALVHAQQVDDVTYEYQKGKKYIVHIVQDGNTLFRMQEVYKVPAKEIIAANPGSEKGIQVGQKLLIPAGVAEAKYADGTMIREHVVVKGETLFNLAKKEGCTVEELTKLNPGSEAGVKLGQKVRIPIKNAAPEQTKPVKEIQPEKQPEKPKEVETTVSFSDTVINHTVLDHETLYSISKRFMLPVEDLQKINQLKNTNIKPGQVLKIPLKKEQIKQVTVREVKPSEPLKKVDEDLMFRKKDVYNIAVMLPFYLDGGEQAMKDISTQFYMGVKLAIDSLEEIGLKAKVYVYDVKNDSAQIVTLLRKPEMKQMDLIFGPLVPQSADIVGAWCKANQIRMVCPSACNSALLRNNPYVYASLPTDITLQRILARYTIDNYSKDQIVLVNSGVARDKELYDAFRERFVELSKSKGNVKLIEIKTEELAAYIRKNGNTVFVVPTRDKAAAMKFMNLLQKSGGKAGSGSISVFATKEWALFDDIRGSVRNKYNLHWASGNDLNYTLPETKNLLRQFRRTYRADMSKYAAHGFDVMYYFTSTLLMDKTSEAGVINAFDPEQVASGSGYESNQAYVLKYVDYELERVGLVHE